MNNELIYFNEYPTIKLRLKEYMDKRHISRNELARAVNTRFEVINKWYYGKVEKMDLDVLARICYVLQVTPSDLLVLDVTTKTEEKV